MATEWTGVIGAVLGAGVGGMVTVASAAVKGRQDERRDAAEAQRREEERKREIAREDELRATDRARGLYAADVYERARELSQALDVLADVLDEEENAEGELPQEWVDEWQQTARAALAKLEAVVPAVVMSSRSVEVLRLVDQVAGQASDAIFFAADSVHHANESVSYARVAFGLLLNACRKDLDLRVVQPAGEVSKDQVEHS